MVEGCKQRDVGYIGSWVSIMSIVTLGEGCKQRGIGYIGSWVSIMSIVTGVKVVNRGELVILGAGLA